MCLDKGKPSSQFVRVGQTAGTLAQAAMPAHPVAARRTTQSSANPPRSARSSRPPSRRHRTSAPACCEMESWGAPCCSRATLCMRCGLQHKRREVSREVRQGWELALAFFNECTPPCPLMAVGAQVSTAAPGSSRGNFPSRTQCKGRGADSPRCGGGQLPGWAPVLLAGEEAPAGAPRTESAVSGRVPECASRAAWLPLRITAASSSGP